MWRARCKMRPRLSITPSLSFKRLVAHPICWVAPAAVFAEGFFVCFDFHRLSFNRTPLFLDFFSVVAFSVEDSRPIRSSMNGWLDFFCALRKLF